MRHDSISERRRLRGAWPVAVLLGLTVAACGEEADLSQGEEQTEESGEQPEILKAEAPGHAGHTPWCAAKEVLDRNCLGCHDGKGTAGTPMGLTSYADYMANAPISSGKKVWQAVKSRIHDTSRPMPPRGLMASADLKVVDDWLNAGAPAGSDPTCSGSVDPNPQPEPWKPGDCDAVYEIRAHGAGANTPYSVPGGQEIHPQIQIDAPWGNEQVQAIGWKPITDNGKVLHHWILYAGMAFLTGWAPGDEVRPPYPSDVGMDMPTGRNALRLDMHYYNKDSRTAQPDRSGVAICVVKGRRLRPKHAAVTMGFTSLPRIPARANNYDSTGTCNVTATQPVHLMTAAPHAHKLAVHMKFTVRKRNGRTIVMHDQPFKFGEQGTYPLNPEVILETGDVVTTTCTFTNPSNRAVRFGESTEDEMCFNFAAYYPKGALRCGGGLGGLGGLGGGSSGGGIFGGGLFGN